MGNCQAAEAATVIIQHPMNNKVERIYCSVTAHQIMTSNPGHYVALVIRSPPVITDNGMPVKQLKILRPKDNLLIGQVYRLISFQDVFNELASKKCLKLEKLLKERGVEVFRKGLAAQLGPTHNLNSATTNRNSVEKREEEKARGVGSNKKVVMRRNHGGGQWKPALQSIAELGVGTL